jgi:hypothetical protein
VWDFQDPNRLGLGDTTSEFGNDFRWRFVLATSTRIDIRIGSTAAWAGVAVSVASARRWADVGGILVGFQDWLCYSD